MDHNYKTEHNELELCWVLSSHRSFTFQL